MRKLFFVIALIIVHLGYSQLLIKPIVKKESPQSQKAVSKSKSKVVSPATLPFWDDFSITKGSPDSIRVWGNDTTLQWNFEESRSVFVNPSLAINPPTLNVATFDGLDESGRFNTSSDPWADQLQSDTIDLFGRGNVVLSFYWQAGGNVEIPEEGDSIRLQFYNPDDTILSWRTQWVIDGGELASNQDSVFTQEAIEVTSEFLTEKFAFRFQSFGDKDGPFDAWHLDWIYLDDGRNRNDALNEAYDEGAFADQISSPITPFYSIPANQFTADNRYIQNQRTSLSYLNEIPDNVVTGFDILLTYSISLANSGEVILTDQRAGNTLTKDFDFDTITLGLTDPFSGDVLLADQDFSSILAFDSAVLSVICYLEEDAETTFDNPPIDLTINDTIRAEYLLHNYYAYDDGTAEYAAGTNINGGQVAIKYWLEESDTLTHIDIHFPNIDPASDDSPLQLRIFKDLNEDPIRAQNVTVPVGRGLNEFTRYELSRPLVLADTFYLGYQQDQNEYIGVGFDRSNPSAAPFIYENKTGEWEQNVRLQGALMIRPVFAKVDSFVLSTPRVTDLKVYPNPTQGSFRIDGEFQRISLYDFSGRMLLSKSREEHYDISSLHPGLYLLTIHRKEGDQTLKIIKK